MEIKKKNFVFSAAAAALTLCFFAAAFDGNTVKSHAESGGEEPFTVDFSENPEGCFLPAYIGEGKGKEEEFSAHYLYDGENKSVKRINDTGKPDAEGQYAALYFDGVLTDYFEMEFTLKIGGGKGLIGVIFSSEDMTKRHYERGNAFYLKPDNTACLSGISFSKSEISSAYKSSGDGVYKIRLTVTEEKICAVINGEKALEFVLQKGMIPKGRLGLFTANTPGAFMEKVRIFLLDREGKRTPFKKSVLVKGLDIPSDEISVPLGGTAPVGAKIMPEDADEKEIMYVSSAPDIASVDNAGNLHALKKGVAEIYAVTKDGSFKDVFIAKVTEEEKYLENILLNLSDHTGKKGDRFYLIPQLVPEDAEDTDVSWRSSDTSVAMVNSGTVILIGEGECVISVSSLDGKISVACRVTVEPEKQKGCGASVLYASFAGIAGAFAAALYLVRRKHL